MKNAQRHSVTLRLSDVQQLRVMREKLKLIGVQKETVSAAEHAEQCSKECERTQQKFAQLVAEQTFCPTRYHIACETLLAAETGRNESVGILEIKEQAELQQRIYWTHMRDQASWLADEVRMLGRKRARADDDKRTEQAMEILRYKKAKS